ncbi:unnamed protein product [Litomosoides sigmodontis]|uniref:Mitochondrial import inner membrane translocase subunit n=1 Tax=Litomosoides sigmodontis TaxID=42156 RepID=A0A3P6TDK8_LITSI|nr:unnamed protein product [Litomosoides sigmodontis]
MNAGITQLKEFLAVYNTLTDSCFRACVREFNHHQLIEPETICVNKCIDKHMRTSQRLMLIFADQAPNKLFKKEESSELQSKS